MNAFLNQLTELANDLRRVDPKLMKDRLLRVEQAAEEAKPFMRLFKEGTLKDFYDMPPVSGLTVLAIAAELDSEVAQRAKELLSSQNAQAVDKRHSKPGGSREKRAHVRAEWATGKYPSRDACAEKIATKIGISFSTARKALRNTLAPEVSTALEFKERRT